MSSEIEDILSRIEMYLEEISSKIDKLIRLTRLNQKQSIQLIKRRLSDVEQDIYSLCNGRKSVSEIAATLGKSVQLISIYLSRLEEGGLVFSKTRGKQKYYERII